MLADTLGRPLRFRITPGQASDIASALGLLRGERASAVLADKAYDSNDLRGRIAGMNATAVIPSKRNRKVAISHDANIYKHRNQSEIRIYLIGYGAALVLTCMAFAAVHWQWARASMTFAIVLAIALVQVIVQFRCFLYISLGRSTRDHLQLILFSTLIVALMVGGTLVILFNLHDR